MSLPFFMITFNKVLSSLIILPILPVIGFLLGWWTMLYIAPEYVWIGILVGLSGGVFGTIYTCQDKIPDIRQISWNKLILIYLFYAICIYGVMMGVPILSPLLGGIAAFIAAEKILSVEDKSLYHYYQRRVIRFTLIISMLTCLASALLALHDSYTAVNIKGMLNLSFTPTSSVIYSIIIFGGAFLLGSQLLIMRLIMRKLLGNDY